MTQPIQLGAKIFGSFVGLARHLFAILLLFSVPAAISQARIDSSRTAQDVRILELGKPIERELKGGEVHTYKIMLTAGQYLHVVVDQRGIDVVVTLFGPDGKQIIEVDSPNGTQGPEPVKIVTESSGSYRLQVRSLEKDVSPGRYEVRIEELREATLQDRNRIAAERNFAEATQLEAQRTAESRRKAIEKYKDALPSWRALGDRSREAVTLNNIGEIYYYLGENQKALDYYNQALPLRGAVDDHRGEATTLNNMGAVYYALGENQKALEYYTQSLPLSRAIDDRSGEASTLSNIGVVYNSLGEKQKALEYYKQALQLRRAVGDRRGEAITLNNIGRVYDDLDEKQKALDYCNQALSQSRAISDRPGEFGALHNTGVIYGKLGENQKALDYFSQALELSRAMGDRNGEAFVRTNLGHIYNSLDEQQKALDNYGQALQFMRAMGNRRGEASTLHNIAKVYSDLGENQKALDYYSQAMPLWQAVGDRRGEAVTLYNIGGVCYDLNEKQKALDYFTQALPLIRAVRDRNSEAKTLAAIARIKRDHGDLDEARAQIETALTIIDSLRTKIVSQDLRASYFASVQDFYEFYIDLLMRWHQLQPSGGNNAVALQASERSRGRSLLEILSEARADIRQGVDSTLLGRERTLHQLLNIKAERFTKLLSGKHTQEDSLAAKQELDALLTEYQEVQARIRSTSPRYAALTQPQPLSVKEIQQQVLDDHTILLEYALGKERSFLWAVTTKSLTSFELPKRAKIDSVARHTYELLTVRNQRVANETPVARKMRVAQADAEYQKAATELSQMLLGPVAGQLGAKRLLVVTDGALQYIPFGALPVPNAGSMSDKEISPPLMMEHEIVSVPSASVLAILRRELGGRHSAAKTVAVLADPVFTSRDPRVKHNLVIVQKKASEASADSGAVNLGELALQRAVRDARVTEVGLDIPRLVFSRQEAEGIAALVPPGERIKALDFAASRSTATSAELSQYRMVHFATHGSLNSVHPELSGIVLSLVNEQGAPQDGFLRLHEIYNLNLPADLVVLSACQTALGKEIRGEGLVGLTRGFMYAGTPRVVASLWKVDDEATAELMERFYKKMLGPEKLRPAAALRAAQISMWQEKRWNFPYYWAAFILQGEWR